MDDHPAGGSLAILVPHTAPAVVSRWRLVRVLDESSADYYAVNIGDALEPRCLLNVTVMPKAVWQDQATAA